MSFGDDTLDPDNRITKHDEMQDTSNPRRMPQSETIKERIDRQTREQLDRPGSAFPIAANALEGRRITFVSYTATVLYDKSGEPVGAELLKNGEPFVIIYMQPDSTPSSDYELAEAYERGYQAAEARWQAKTKAPWDPGAEAKKRANEMTYTQQAIEDVAHTLGAHGNSYTTHSEFENFEDQAAMGEMPSLRNVFRGMIGQKLTREKSIRARIIELGDTYAKGGLSESEYDAQMNPDVHGTLAWSWLASIRDICGYGLLFFGWSKSTFAERATSEVPEA